MTSKTPYATLRQIETFISAIKSVDVRFELDEDRISTKGNCHVKQRSQRHSAKLAIVRYKKEPIYNDSSSGRHRQVLANGIAPKRSANAVRPSDSGVDPRNRTEYQLPSNLPRKRHSGSWRNGSAPAHRTGRQTFNSSTPHCFVRSAKLKTMSRNAPTYTLVAPKSVIVSPARTSETSIQGEHHGTPSNADRSLHRNTVRAMIQKICVYSSLEDMFALMKIPAYRYVPVEINGQKYEGIETFPGGWIFLYAPELRANLQRGSN